MSGPSSREAVDNQVTVYQGGEVSPLISGGNLLVLNSGDNFLQSLLLL